MANTGLRFDGAYQVKTGTSTRFIRFYPDGAVIHAGFTGDENASDCAMWLNLESPLAQHGKYQLKKGFLSTTKIIFTIASPQGSIDYTGDMQQNTIKFLVHSNINGYEAHETYTFIPLSFPDWYESLANDT
jgi:hypothetical protein